jgi:O-antigen/teichoic acid export membrane protein
MHRLTRYALAFIGPAGGAVAQFALSLLLLRTLSPQDFGGFSVLLVASQFSWGIWSALFGALLPVLMAQADARLRAVKVDCVFATNLLAAIPVSLLFFALSLRLHFTSLEAGLFALYVGLALLRWFARAYAYACGRQIAVLMSDLAYSFAMLGACGMLLVAPVEPLLLACGALALGSGIGLLAFGGAHLLRQFVQLRPSSIGHYAALWREHTGWSLLGVLTTEATTNAHSYIVTLVAGPGQFALIAASALVTRPATVVLNALNEYERAQMAREIAAGDGSALRRSMRFFRAMLGVAWLGTGVAIAGLLGLAPRLVYPVHYDLVPLAWGAAMWMAVIAVRVLRAPESAMMQGGGAFRTLAHASVWSAIVSIAAVLTMLWLAAPIWSILGILAGELVFGWRLWPAARRWRLANMPERRGADGMMAGATS